MRTALRLVTTSSDVRRCAKARPLGSRLAAGSAHWVTRSGSRSHESASATTESAVTPQKDVCPAALGRGSRVRARKVSKMNSPETQVNLDPAIDPSLLELDGTTYKDRSPAAAARRAAYHRARSLKLRSSVKLRSASSSNTTTREQPSSAASATGQFARLDCFTNNGTAPNYTLLAGDQGPGQEGWIMHCDGPANQQSKLRFDFPFNDGSGPFTLIMATMRGAPDNGRESYVVLREQACAEEGQSGCDEIDIVEYYGQSSAHRSEWTFYGRGQTPYKQANGTYPATTDPGQNAWTYGLYLENGSYIQFWLGGALDPLFQWSRDASQGYVPVQPMYLYAGEWDCTSSQSSNSQAWCTDTPPGDFTGESFMALYDLWLENAGVALQGNGSCSG